MIYTLHPRKSVIENVDRMINCGDPSFGGAMYGCGKCGTLKFVPFRCHSRFCPTCGTKYSIDRTTSMSFKLINVQHRHCVFTIDSELRHFFLEDRELLGLLFEAVQSVILRMFHKDNKTEKFTPGFILVLHTFGRDLKWNPHIHCLLSEGGIGNSGLWRAKTHFNYTYLRNAFRTALLNLMEKKLGSSFKKVKAKCYKEHKDGFYVYAKPNKCNPTVVAKYIGRYLGRPVIATSRIDAYDGENVTFHYNRHEDDQLVVETIPVMDFIARLIQHIPENISSKSATMGFMPDLARMIRKSLSPLQRKNVKLFFLLIVGAIVHYPPLAMTRLSALAVAKQCFSLSFIINISIFL